MVLDQRYPCILQQYQVQLPCTCTCTPQANNKSKRQTIKYHAWGGGPGIFDEKVC